MDENIEEAGRRVGSSVPVGDPVTVVVSVAVELTVLVYVIT